ncbi:NAD(P)/FAD-dependent oxidoreductase [Spongisporangium articulatum]|uniref:NAD(P)/FAD-dependent oxidoreductase n=1 Tax=Spongisporangium articulatum TaxID=3362603 RepID=A0ABW8AR29_9ACTN
MSSGPELDELDRRVDDAAPVPLWLDSAARPAPRPGLRGLLDADLVVVGGGFTGLWTALQAVEREPGRSVVLLEAGRLADAATGRNGGFCEASLTHGETNGRDRWPDEFDTLTRLGEENLRGIAATIEKYGIDCDFELSGALSVATRPHEVADLEPGEPGFLDADAVRRRLASPTYLAGRMQPDPCALVDPARLAWGLAAAAESLGVRVVEGTPVTSLRPARGGVDVETVTGVVHARVVALATNAYRPLLRRLRFHTVPVYDYVLATEPLTAEQLSALGWEGRPGVSDSGNQFHYYRLTADDRIVFGGYDAIYHYGRSLGPQHEDRRETFRVLARHFDETFPQLTGVRFTHRWGGAIDTCTRFCAFFGTARRGRVAYALGFTGLGVGASRFAGDVMLDLLAGADTERTRLRMVRRRPVPFPPEPLAWIGIRITTRSLARADATGRRNLWLRVLDRLGLGFDS